MNKTLWVIMVGISGVACSGTVTESPGSGRTAGTGGTATVVVVTASGGSVTSRSDSGIDYGCLHSNEQTDVAFDDAGASRCSVKLPDFAPDRFTPASLVANVYTPSGLATIMAVSSPSSCDMTGGLSHGWYYDDPSHPTRVEFCSETCREIGELDGTVWLSFGCVHYPRL